MANFDAHSVDHYYSSEFSVNDERKSDLRAIEQSRGSSAFVVRVTATYKSTLHAMSRNTLVSIALWYTFKPGFHNPS